MSLIIRLQISVFIVVSANGADWPYWRGPERNGVSQEMAWRSNWNELEPEILWTSKVGTGFSCFAVADGRVFTAGNKGDVGTLYCFEAESGTVLWKHDYPSKLNPKYYEGGTSSTPIIDGESGYFLSNWGVLFCFSVVNGDILWRRDFVEEKEIVIHTWGLAGSPLIEGDLLILNIGKSGLAVNKKTGEDIWASEKGMASYCTPVSFDLNGKRCAILVGHRNIFNLELATGNVLWQFPFETKYDTNSADAVLYKETFFVGSHSLEARCFSLSELPPKVKWNHSTRTHMDTGLVYEDHLYAFHGVGNKPGGELRCIDLQDGVTRWAHDDLGVGTVILGGNRLIILSEKGELVAARASSEGYEELGHIQVLGGRCWTAPVLANGMIYCRNAAGKVVCVDVRM